MMKSLFAQFLKSPNVPDSMTRRLKQNSWVVWAPVAHLTPKSPNVQAPATRVFDLNRQDFAARVIYLDGYAFEHHALEQASAAGVFHLNFHAPKQAPAPRVLRLNRRDPAPRFFHLEHHTIRQTLARPITLPAS